MKAWFSADTDGRILASTTYSDYAAGMTEFQFPDDFDFTKQDDYIIKDGKLVNDPRPASAEEIEVQTQAKRTAQLNVAAALFVRTQSASLSDEEALEVSELFDNWEGKNDGFAFIKGTVYRYKDDIYRCLSDHSKQESWNPADSHSLWVRVRPSGEVTEWEQVQPGVTEAYSKGDKVTHNGKTWTSDIDNNVWEPGVYGWTEING